MPAGSNVKRVVSTTSRSASYRPVECPWVKNAPVPGSGCPWPSSQTVRTMSSFS